MTLLGNPTFVGMFYFSSAQKVVGIPHQAGKRRCLRGAFPHFLNFPTESFIVRTASLR